MLNIHDCTEQHSILTPDEATDAIATLLIEQQLEDPIEVIDLVIRAADFCISCGSYMLALGMQIGLRDPAYATRVVAAWRAKDGEDTLLDADAPALHEHLQHRFPLLPEVYTHEESITDS